MKYIVLRAFNDITGFKRAGDFVDADEQRARKLIKYRLIGHVVREKEEEQVEEVPQEKIEEVKKEIVHIGGGFYELPDGRKIKGKEAALKAMEVYTDDMAE